MTEPRGIDRDSDRPAYRQLADILRDQIHTGDLKAGNDLPSKQQLSQRYGVSINTVEGALRELKTEGLIIVERGRNSRVRPVRLIGPSRYEAAIANYNPDQGSRFAAEHGVRFDELGLDRIYSTIPAPARISQALNIADGALVVQRRWLHVVQGVPVRLAWSYLEAAKYGDSILCDPNEPPWPGGTIAQLRHIGRHPVVDPPTEVRCRPASEEETTLLDLGSGSTVLETFRVHVEPSGFWSEPWRPLECSVHVYPAGGVVLSFNTVNRRRLPYSE